MTPAAVIALILTCHDLAALTLLGVLAHRGVLTITLRRPPPRKPPEAAP